MRRLAMALLLVACAVTPAVADHLLQFESGRTIIVGAWRIEGEWLYLELPDEAGSLVVSKALLFDARDLNGPVGVVAWRRAPRYEAPAGPPLERARYEFARSVEERHERRTPAVEAAAQAAAPR